LGLLESQIFCCYGDITAFPLGISLTVISSDNRIINQVDIAINGYIYTCIRFLFSIVFISIG